MSSASYVLIVDDDTDMAAVIKVVLDAEGYSCACVDNGLDAVETAAAAKPALVLLDMMMPIMNGWECAYELRQRYGRTLPIVIVTAAEHAESWRAEIGADDVLAKPFDIHALLRVVATYVGEPQPAS